MSAMRTCEVGMTLAEIFCHKFILSYHLSTHSIGPRGERATSFYCQNVTCPFHRITDLKVQMFCLDTCCTRVEIYHWYRWWSNRL